MGTDFEIFAGDTRDIIVNIVDQDGAAVDLTNGAVSWSAATNDWPVNTAAVVISKTSITAGEIDLANGSFVVHLLSADTQGIAGNFYHEAQVTLSDGTIGTPLTGRLKIKSNLIAPR
jgi:hypothetical protein